MPRTIIPQYADNAVLTKAELGKALDLAEKTIEELVQSGQLPVAYLTDRLPRFVYGQVVERLRQLAVERSTQRKAS